MKTIEETIGEENAEEMRRDFFDNFLCGGDMTAEDVSDFMSGYGLEMDYIEQLLF